MNWHQVFPGTDNAYLATDDWRYTVTKVMCQQDDGTYGFMYEAWRVREHKDSQPTCLGARLKTASEAKALCEEASKIAA